MSSLDTTATQAKEFAQRIENLLMRVLGPNDDLYTAVPIANMMRDGRMSYAIRQAASKGISLKSDGETVLKLSYNFLCSCSCAGVPLHVDKSVILLTGEPEHVPLFHFDYVREPKSDIPSAHINIYGSNDVATRIMLACNGGKRSKSRRRQYLNEGAFPTFSSLHFPVGGDCLRPGLEDALQMAIYEFHIDVQDGWLGALSQSRAEYRERQIRSLVREFPDLAYDVLQGIGSGIKVRSVCQGVGVKRGDLSKY